jgi:hypothetical protein
MSRYIDAELIPFSRDYSRFVATEDDVDSVPTADVVEVVHGEWETIPDCQPDRLLAYRHICSVCKTTYKDLNCHGHNYCHWCGAKMDGERSENGK